MINFLMAYGYTGMAGAAFLAGSAFPFSSEAVMLGLLAAGLDGWQLIVWGTIGNVLGSMFNYMVGRLGKTGWIERYLHVKPQQLERTQKFLEGRGAWMGLFTFLPVIGTAIALALGLMRANIVISLVSITISKFVRYLLLVYGAQGLFNL